MTKYGFRFLIAALTFAVSLVPVWFLKISAGTETFCPIFVDVEKSTPSKMSYSTSPTGKVQVEFKGYDKYENRPTLTFEIINRNTKPAKYWSGLEKTNWSHVKFNGKEKEVFLCGTGMKEFELLPGDSFTVEVFPDNTFYEYLDKKGSIQIGYGFVLKKNKFEKFWSEPLELSDYFRNEIKRNVPNR